MLDPQTEPVAASLKSTPAVYGDGVARTIRRYYIVMYIASSSFGKLHRVKFWTTSRSILDNKQEHLQVWCGVLPAG